MTTKKNRFENKYFIGCLTVIAGCSLFFQNCSPLNSQFAGTTAVVVTEVTDSSNSAAKLTWATTSGTVSPEYQYSVVYTVDFANKNLKISVNKGASVTGLVSPANKTISETQTAQIRTLISKVKASTCKDGAMSLGGGSDSIGIYSSTARTSPETVIYGTDCTGLSTSFFQATSGFSDLTTYLKSL